MSFHWLPPSSCCVISASLFDHLNFKASLWCFMPSPIIHCPGSCIRLPSPPDGQRHLHWLLKHASGALLPRKRGNKTVLKSSLCCGTFVSSSSEYDLSLPFTKSTECPLIVGVDGQLSVNKDENVVRLSSIPLIATTESLPQSYLIGGVIAKCNRLGRKWIPCYQNPTLT